MGSAVKRVELREPGWLDRLALALLEVRPHQRAFVASNFRTMQECMAEPDAEVYAIATRTRVVGLAALLYEDEDWWLWRLMIGRQHQDHGYGRDALLLLRELVHSRGGHRICVTYLPGPGDPAPFYRRLGFKPSGQNAGEVFMTWAW